jgi:hypothetical protein
MENGKKIALGVTAAMIALVGLRVGLIYKANHEEAPPPKPAYEGPKMTDDDAVTMNLKKQRPDSLKDERELIGKTIWVSAADQMDYFHYASHHADYAHPVGTLMGAEPLVVKDVFEQVAPAKAAVLLRIPAGERHVLLAFTLPKSTDPKAEYAVPVGYRQGGFYTFSTDEIFFYVDPRISYKHWGADVWAHIDKHEVVPGMSENQAMMSLGQIIVPSGDSVGNRTVTYDNNSHPMKIVFEHNKAVTITPEKN